MRAHGNHVTHEHLFECVRNISFSIHHLKFTLNRLRVFIKRRNIYDLHTEYGADTEAVSFGRQKTRIEIVFTKFVDHSL